MSGPRLRFAPSPTGSLHLGNARTALFNWLIARKQGGTLVLRIEDSDTARDEEGSEASILEDLRWLGLDWDEGPDAGGPRGPYRQSEREALYREAADRLLAIQAAFRCFCGAAAERGHGPAPGAAGTGAGHRDPCRSLPAAESARRAAAGEPAAIRFRVPPQDAYAAFSVRFDDRLHGVIDVPLAQVPDAVLLRHDGRPTYNFGVVVDDIAMAIDLVLRGDDHLSNTPLQVLLYQAFGATPPQFAHVPMVLGPDGERLSKRHGATSVAAWRERGVPPEALLNGLALLGWSPSGDRTIVSLDEIVADFDLGRVGRSAAVFDPVKLEWISSQHIHAMDPGELAGLVADALVRGGALGPGQVREAEGWVAALAEFLRPSLARSAQAVEQCEPVFHAGGPLDETARAALADEGARRVLESFSRRVASEVAGPASWPELAAALRSETGAKGRALFQPIRVAVTGRDHGRELEHLIPLIADGHRALPGRVPALAARVSRTLEGLS